MESAETINPGNFKIRGNLLFHSGKGADARTDIALAAGYGFTPRFDAERQLAFCDGVTFFGRNGEFWVVKDRQLDVSAGGLHARRGDQTADIWGIDLTGAREQAPHAEVRALRRGVLLSDRRSAGPRQPCLRDRA